MPMKTIHCKICGKAIRGTTFGARMKKLRRHRKKAHPTAHKRSIRKALRTKRERGIINKGGGSVGRKKKKKKKQQKKWGKIGAPHSAKRKRHLARIRKKRR